MFNVGDIVFFKNNEAHHGIVVAEHFDYYDMQRTYGVLWFDKTKNPIDIPCFYYADCEIVKAA